MYLSQLSPPYRFLHHSLYRILSNYSAKKNNLGHSLALKLECKNYTSVSGGAYQLEWNSRVNLFVRWLSRIMPEVSFGGVVRGFHVYKAVWTPVIGEELSTELLNFLICTSSKITLLDHVLLLTFSEMILKRVVDHQGVVAQRYSHLESQWQ